MFKIAIEEKVSKVLSRLPEKLRNNIIKKLKVLEEEFSYSLDIKKLKGYQNHYRLRVGELRILFYLEGSNIIVYKIGKRESVYE